MKEIEIEVREEGEKVLCTIPTICGSCGKVYKVGELLEVDSIKSPTWIKCSSCKVKVPFGEVVR